MAMSSGISTWFWHAHLATHLGVLQTILRSRLRREGDGRHSPALFGVHRLDLSDQFTTFVPPAMWLSDYSRSHIQVIDVRRLEGASWGFIFTVPAGKFYVSHSTLPSEVIVVA